MARDDDENIFFPILGGVASGAAGGAALGSALPGFGTAAGALTGAGAGLFAGISDIAAQRRAEEEAARQQAALNAELEAQQENYETHLRGIELGEAQEVSFADRRASEAGARAGFNEGQIFAIQDQARDSAAQRSSQQAAVAAQQAAAIRNANRSQILNEFTTAQALQDNATQGGGEALQALGNVAGAAAQIAPLMTFNQEAEIAGSGLFSPDPTVQPERAQVQPVGPEGGAGHPVFSPGTGAIPAPQRAQDPPQAPQGIQGAPAAQEPPTGQPGPKPGGALAQHDNVMLLDKQQAPTGAFGQNLTAGRVLQEQSGVQFSTESHLSDISNAEGVSDDEKNAAVSIFKALEDENMPQDKREALVEAYLIDTIQRGAHPEVRSIVESGMGEFTGNEIAGKQEVVINDLDDYQRLANISGLTDSVHISYDPKRKKKGKPQPQKTQPQKPAPGRFESSEVGRAAAAAGEAVSGAATSVKEGVGEVADTAIDVALNPVSSAQKVAATAGRAAADNAPSPGGLQAQIVGNTIAQNYMERIQAGEPDAVTTAIRYLDDKTVSEWDESDRQLFKLIQGDS